MSIADNVQSRQLADEALILAMEFISEADLTPEQASRAFDRMREGLIEITHWQPPTIETRLRPMSDDECREFEKQRLKFGKHMYEAVGDVPLDYLLWLDEQQDFRQDLRRYLANQTIQKLQD